MEKQAHAQLAGKEGFAKLQKAKSKVEYWMRCKLTKMSLWAKCPGAGHVFAKQAKESHE